MEPISKGQYLVYRKPKSGAAGSWSACFVNLDTKKQTRTHIGTADDFQDANGKSILAYAQAQAKAMQWFKAMERQAAIEADGDIVPDGPFTVANALEAYYQDRERQGKKGMARDKQIARTWIIPYFGNTPVSKLTRIRIEKWLDEMANTPKRLRTKIGREQAYAPPPMTSDEKRARRCSANRNLSVLKAALTFAIDRRLADAPERPWQLVKRYSGVAKARIRFLTQEEQVRLVNVCPSDFKALVRGALLTGCRYGELARLKVKDYDPDNGSIFIAESKSDKPRHVYLTDEGKALFDELTAKPDTESLIFTNSIKRRRRIGGEEGMWMQSDTKRYMHNACRAAGIELLTFHELRHTYASTLVNRGCILSVVAKLLGHADTSMVEKHYGHLAPSTVRDEVMRTMPKLGIA
jgi:integrase